MVAVNFRLTNLVKHVESSLRKFQNTVEGIIDDNNGEAWIDGEDAGRCHRIMEAVNQGLKSLQENRDGEVLRTPHHTITWHLLFEEVKVQRKKGNSFNKYRIRRSNKQMHQTSQALS